MEDLDERHLVTLLEAIYSLDLDDAEWLRQTVCALAMLCGPRHHYVGYFYDASNAEDFLMWDVCKLRFPAEVEAAFSLFQTVNCPGLVKQTFRSLPVGSARLAGAPYLTPVMDSLHRSGWGDVLNINGLDPSGIGCLLGVGLRDQEAMPARKDLALFRRISMHLSTAVRCRRQLGFLTHRQSVTGTVETVRTRDRLQPATLARSGCALLMDARWTLVDYFEKDGQRYVVARENRVEAQALSTLTDRERQVVMHAALGYNNKEVAYTLGVSAATVRVLMARAATKFGVRTRAELLVHPSLQLSVK